MRCDGYGQPEPGTLFGSGLRGASARFRLSGGLDQSGRVLAAGLGIVRPVPCGRQWVRGCPGRELDPWLWRPGLSGGLDVAWSGHVPDGRPQLTRKSKSGVLVSSTICVPSGRARHRWDTPVD